LTSRPATERTQEDLTPMTEDQGEGALFDLFHSDEPKEAETETETEIEAEAEVKTEADAVEDSAEEGELPELSPGELSDETETHSGDEESPETKDAETEMVTLADGSQITLQDAQAGYLRQTDYTKKTTQLAEERRQAGEQNAETIKHLSKLVNDLEQQVISEPDWSALIDEYGADRVMQTQIEWNKQQQSKHSAIVEVNAQKDYQQRLAVSEAKGELLKGTYEPKWIDPKKLEEGLVAVAKYADDTYGIPSSALAETPDPNFFIILDKARRFDELQNKVPQVKKAMAKKPKPMRPGSTVKIKKPTSDAFARVRKSGTDEDALAALSSLRRAS
jgi:hypothetical protein